jgi:lyso-ornithine lipid O-acyltransferase
MEAVRAAALAIALILWTLVLLPVQLFAVITGLRLQRVIPRLYHRGNCWLLGLNVRRQGADTASAPVLYVANHASYLDILVLSTLLDASFVAKAEVAGWPLFGFLAKSVNTIFVERRPSRSGGQRDQMRVRLEKGQSLILFPEGTSSDGNRVLPFNSTFFSLAEMSVNGAPLCVQPISLAYTRYNHLPMSRRDRPYLAWYGDMGLAGHLWDLLCRGPATVEVFFHPPLVLGDGGSRKVLAKRCESLVTGGVSDLLSGRLSRVVAKPA